MLNKKMHMAALLGGLAGMSGLGFPSVASSARRDPLEWQRRREASRWNTPEIMAHNEGIQRRRFAKNDDLHASPRQFRRARSAPLRALRDALPA